MHEIGPFSIPSMRAFVPEKLRPWIVILFVIIFQLSGGVYLAAVSEMVGSTALLQEDIMMAGYASLVGMSLTFAIMFRLKFRFASKTTLLVCCTALIICNLICMYTHNVPTLVGVNFIAGFFRMWGTFECNSTVQLWITPKRDLSIFFCYIYLLVQGCLQLSGVITAYTAFFAKWEYMHWLMIGLLIAIMLATAIIYRNYRTMPKLPLFGIDWLGAVLWGLIMLCIIFVCLYGEHYDWFSSVYIQMATSTGFVLLALNLWRASFIRHPFIELKTWCFPSVYITFLLYLVIDTLLAPSHLFEHIYMEGILGYDSLHVASLNWVILAATITGAIFTYITFARHKWRYKTMTVIAFSCITLYLMWFYFIIDYNLPKEALIIPLFLRGFGYVIIAICFITALSRVPFQQFFQTLSIQAFASAACGGVIGSAILGRVLTIVTKKNAMLLSATLDHVNPTANYIPTGQLYGIVQQQALLVTMKELYGWLTIIALFCLLLFMLKESTIRPMHVWHPRYKVIRKYIKHELRITERLKIVHQRLTS